MDQLKIDVPSAKPSIIEIDKPAFNFVTARHQFKHAFYRAILESTFNDGSFVLVFTMGVLIHINMDQLLEHMERMYKYLDEYILFGEYFKRTPASIEYEGERANYLSATSEVFS